MMTPILLLTIILSACNFGNKNPEENHAVATDTIREADSAISAVTVEGYSADYLMGKFDPAKHPQFTKIQKSHTDKPNIYMRKEAYEAFSTMSQAAAQDGVIIKIISATRNFEYQKGIWEKKWQREKYKGWKNIDKVKDILKYSSMPGTSRHHWGTDVDFNSVELSYFNSGEGKKLYEWLQAHASEYGFAQTYTSKSTGRTGYEEEKWHWSYMPLSGPMLTEYNAQITYENFGGFSGAEVAIESDVIQLYVNGIDGTLK